MTSETNPEADGVSTIYNADLDKPGVLWINSMGEMGRHSRVEGGSFVGEETLRLAPADGLSAHMQLSRLLGREATRAEMEKLWVMAEEGFLRSDEERALYAQWKLATTIFGVDSEQTFTSDGETYSFAVYVNHGEVWLCWEPCFADGARQAWAAFDRIAADVGGALNPMQMGRGLAGPGNDMERHVSLEVPITTQSEAELRVLGPYLAERISGAMRLLPPVCDEHKGRVGCDPQCTACSPRRPRTLVIEYGEDDDTDAERIEDAYQAAHNALDEEIRRVVSMGHALVWRWT